MLSSNIKVSITPVQQAIFDGNITLALKLIESKNCDLNECDSNGQTALHWSAGRGNIDLIKLLVKHGADISISDNWKHTPLHCAIKEGEDDAVKYLLTQDGFTPDCLHFAIECKEADENTIKLLMPYVDNVNSICKECGETELHNAFNLKRFDIIEVLLDAGANVNSRSTKNGQTILHKTIINMNKENHECYKTFLQSLLDRCPNLFIKDFTGKTVIEYLKEYQNLNILTEHICKLEAALMIDWGINNKYLDETNIFYLKCKEEVLKLKETKLGEIFLYRMLNKNFDPIKALLYNENLRENLSTNLNEEKFLKSFPIYGNILMHKFNPYVMTRIQIISDCIDILYQLFPMLPSNIIILIISYLNNNNLEKLTLVI